MMKNLTGPRAWVHLAHATFMAGATFASTLAAAAVLVPDAVSSPPAICPAPFTADARATTVTVGLGTAESCTEAALATALAKGGVIRFNCGGPAIIKLTSQKTLRTDVNTTLDGQGKITLDGGGKNAFVVLLFAQLAGHEDDGHHSESDATEWRLERHAHSVGARALLARNGE